LEDSGLKNVKLCLEHLKSWAAALPVTVCEAPARAAHPMGCVEGGSVLGLTRGREEH